jgi:18S rRNA (guanine1575-N7)-methyltransferase
MLSHILYISISVLQWLLNAETSHPTSSPPHRLTRFFTTLHSSLRNPSRAIFQFYPSSDDQIQLITSIARKAGFGGGIVVDYPNSKKAKKVFLCLFVGGNGGQEIPKGLEGEEVEEENARFERRRERERRREKNGKRKNVKDKDWILKKKEVISRPTLSYSQLTTVLIVISAKGQGGCSTRLQIYRTQTENSVLSIAFATKAT